MPNRTRYRLFSPISLRVLMSAPFLVLIILTVGTAGYVSFVHGQEAVNFVAGQLRSTITQQIADHLRSFLETPHQITLANQRLIHQGLLDPYDPQSLQHHFQEQVETHKQISSIYFGNPAGGVAGSGREGTGGSMYVYSTQSFQAGPFTKTDLDAQNRPTGLITRIPDFDARNRAWYSGALWKNGPAWSDIYILFTGQDMALAASRPVYNFQQQLIGVVSVDIFLSQINDFLRSIATQGQDSNPVGQSFVIERSGLLVASSTSETLVVDQNGDGLLERLSAQDSSIPLVRAAARTLLKTYGEFSRIPAGEQQLTFSLDGQRQFLQVLPVSDPYGIDWIVVVTMPESAFMASINANNRSAGIIVSVALVAASLLSLLISTRIAQRIAQLNDSTQALGRGHWEAAIAENSHIREISALAGSFNHMRQQLHQTMDDLNAEITRRKRIESSLRESEERYTRLYTELQDNARFLALLNGITRAALQADDLNAMLQTLADQLGELFQADGCYLTRWDDEQKVTLPAAANRPYHEIYRQSKLPEGELTLTQSVLIAEQPLAVEDVFDTPYMSPMIAGRFPTRSLLGLPLIAGEHKLGAILIGFNTPHQFSDDEILRGEMAAAQISLALAKAELVITDSLTGVYNRRGLFELGKREVERALRYSSPLSAILFDIDHFKTINDRYGHSLGDQILCQVAERCRNNIRLTDVLGRYGGEEFVILLPETNRNVAMQVADRLRRCICDTTFLTDYGSLAVTISIGVAGGLGDQSEITNLDTLIMSADNAMYAAKLAGRNCIRVIEDLSSLEPQVL